MTTKELLEMVGDYPIWIKYGFDSPYPLDDDEVKFGSYRTDDGEIEECVILG